MKRHFSLTVLLALFASIPIMSLAAQDRRPDNDRRAPDERITNGPVVEHVGDTSATIAWTTNTGGSSVVRYGTEPNRLGQMAESPYADNDRTRSQNHRVQLNNLRPGTTYYFFVDSGQGEGTGTDARSGVQRFTTRGSRHDGRRDDHDNDRDHDRDHDRDQPPPQ